MATVEATVDFTNSPDGSSFPFYKTPLGICPLCKRVGQQLDIGEEIFAHVITLQYDTDTDTYHAPVWISDMCKPTVDSWTIVEPATNIEARVKHPWELNKSKDTGEQEANETV